MGPVKKFPPHLQVCQEAARRSMDRRVGTRFKDVMDRLMTDLKKVMETYPLEILETPSEKQQECDLRVKALVQKYDPNKEGYWRITTKAHRLKLQSYLDRLLKAKEKLEALLEKDPKTGRWKGRDVKAFYNYYYPRVCWSIDALSSLPGVQPSHVC